MSFRSVFGYGAIGKAIGKRPSVIHNTSAAKPSVIGCGAIGKVTGDRPSFIHNTSAAEPSVIDSGAQGKVAGKSPLVVPKISAAKLARANVSGGNFDWKDLQAHLKSIDKAQYGAYQRLKGKNYHHHGESGSPNFTLIIDHIQGDSYAPPSHVRCVVPWDKTGFPSAYLQSDIRRIALCDFVSRVAGAHIHALCLNQNAHDTKSDWSGPRGGAISLCTPGQQVLPRTSVVIADDQTIELRPTVSLPAAGRSILSKTAHQILAVNLVDVVKHALLHENIDQAKLEEHIQSVEAQHSLRAQLPERGLVAFIANGAILPRASGTSQAPMIGADAVPFQSPKEFEVTLTASTGKTFTGMGIPRGVCMLTGGCFHGKSTLMKALELGIYDHVPGDGREGVVTDPSAFKVKAEDGRSISNTDITPFISHLPGCKDMHSFSTQAASGATSMAANIQEALEIGCKTLLIDEDTSATNLLVRDGRMQDLVGDEPITLISKVRALYEQYGVSTIIVVGGQGDWLSVSDHIIHMKSYIPRCAAQEAKRITLQHPTTLRIDQTYGSIPSRTFKLNLSGSLAPLASRTKFIKMKPLARDAAADKSSVEPGLDLTGLDQIVDIGQTRTLALLLKKLEGLSSAKAVRVEGLTRQLNGFIGIDKPLTHSIKNGDLVGVRHVDLVAAISRVRGDALRTEVAAEAR